MARRAAAILVLMLTLPAAALLVAADGADADTIRLPSDGDNGLAATPTDKVVAPTESAPGGALEAERPWACCNGTVCRESFPPICRCLDEVKECAAACKLCEPSGINHTCNDWYFGDPGPKCA
ncbi:Bowman-Birk type trypsin inhibitor TI1 [Hordeum vulgare]|nr:Bowman-Birk type trypsin inhibitor TI1 [Hordeum vulgare]